MKIGEAPRSKTTGVFWGFYATCVGVVITTI